MNEKHFYNLKRGFSMDENNYFERRKEIILDLWM